MTRNVHCLTRASLFGIAVSLLTACAARASDSAVLQAEQARIAVVAKVAPAVVAIFGPGGGGGGSGVLISPDGLALTNHHVTSGAGTFMKCGLADGVLYDGVLVGIDPTGDVAMVRLFGRDDFPFVTLGDSDALQVGDWTFAMGNPFLLATDFQPTVTYGIVSGMHRYQYPAGTFLEYADCIQIDASINPGNSGGPLFNATGELVGINGRGSFEKRGRVNSGAGYAISINQIKHFMDYLKGGLIVDHATLGATVATRDDGSVVVTEILEKSEAYRRGLRRDDEIVSFAGRPIRSVNQFKNVLGIFPKGWRLPLVYRREGKKQEIHVRLRGLHRQSELTGNPGRNRQQPTPEPQPRPDGKPGKKPKDQPDKKLQRPEPAKPPEHLAKFHIERAGFANYYFNQLERDRTLKGLAAFGDLSKQGGPWKASGTLEKDSVPFELTLNDKVAGLTYSGGQKVYAQELSSDATLEDEPQGTGGLLLALHHFRLMLTRGKDGFSEFYYLGSEPFDGAGERVNVLYAELAGARSNWYFSRASGALLGFDLYREDEVDACEVRFESTRDSAAPHLPESMLVRHADQEFGRFRFAAWQPSPGSEPSKPAATEPAKDSTR